MKSILLAILALTSAFSLQPSALLFAAPLGTAFTYQGRLADAGTHAQGMYDFRFAIYDAGGGGTAIAGPITNSPVGVTNGLFTALLDFGAGAFTSDARWLELGVRTNGSVGGFTTLAPRQALTAAPFATWASSAATAQTAAVANNLSGTLPSDKLAGTYTGSLNFFNETNQFYGEMYGDIYGDHYGDSFGDFYGDGYGITHLNASQLWYGTMPDGRLSSNVALLPANQVFTGSNLFTGPLVATNGSNVLQGTFTGTNIFAGVITATNVNNVIVGSFTGDGGGLTNLNTAQFANSVLTNGQTGVTLSGVFDGSGAGLTSLNANNLASGTVAEPRIAAAIARDSEVFSLVLASDGAGSGLDADLLDGMDSSGFAPSAHEHADWHLDGNSGTTSGSQFLGTTDNQPLEFKVNNQRGLRLEPTASGAPNLIGGSAANAVASGTVSATIGGGLNNSIQNNANTSVIAGGGGNTVETNSYSSFIGGGTNNSIRTGSYWSAIAGGCANSIETNSYQSFIGGGYDNYIQARYSTIGGGVNNNMSSSYASTIAGGYGNTCVGGNYATIGGGEMNGIETSTGPMTIGGGLANHIRRDAHNSTIGGGYMNDIGTNSYYATIAGGEGNATLGRNDHAFIGGGLNNKIQDASGRCTIGGGVGNIVQSNVLMATISGGSANTIGTNANCATIPGGYYNIAGGSYSFAAGYYAQATNAGSFVWADSSTSSRFSSTADNQFSIRSAGGVRIATTYLGTVGAQLTPGATSWTSLSDRNAKKNFQPVDTVAVLDKLAAIPVEQWNYNWEQDGDVPNLGPMAQDFKAAFYPGRDDKGISTLEFDGVELAAIQGLNQKVEAQRAENAELKQEVAELKRLVNQLSTKLNGGAQ
jgi:hypothetical protein